MCETVKAGTNSLLVGPHGGSVTVGPHGGSVTVGPHTELLLCPPIRAELFSSLR